MLSKTYENASVKCDSVNETRSFVDIISTIFIISVFSCTPDALGGGEKMKIPHRPIGPLRWSSCSFSVDL